MTFYYHWSYDDRSDEFYAYVDDGTKRSAMLYQIDDTKEVCDYIATGKMSHIDDVEGLAKFLVEQNFMVPGDILELVEEMLY